MAGPMEGIRVVELALWVAGPSAAGVLADWGADVIIDPADVSVTNLRPAALARAGLDHPALAARNPRLVYAEATGYGTEGPEKEKRAIP